MAPNDYNLYSTKRAARQEAWHGPGTAWNPFSKTTRRSSSFPAQVQGEFAARQEGWHGPDNTSNRHLAHIREVYLQPKVIDAETRPRIERIKLEYCREGKLQDTNDFNHNNSKPQNVEELYWDPMGELSNFEAGALSVSEYFSVNIRTESREDALPIDMHVLELGPSGKLFKIILKDTEGLSEYLEQTPTEERLNVVYLLQDISIDASPIVSRLLGCSIDVFRDHFKRASDDVAFMLPSESCKQNHVVIPYQRCYRRSSAKSSCEIQNKRSTFCHGNLVSSEEHVTIWMSQTNQYHSTSSWIALSTASSEWQTVIREQEAYMLPGFKPQYLATTEVRLSERESFEEYLRQTWSMLKMNLRVIDSLRKSRFYHGEQYSAVEESRKAIQQANDVKALTVLATVYIPLSFVAGVFGMNVKELNSGIDVDIWLYFAISIPVTIASMVLLWKWEWLTRTVKNFSIRPNNNYSPRNTVSEALSSMGKMTAGIGKPRDVQIGHDLEK
ncbi:hypothetical protein ACHAP3_007857 [Botrytis cinerea]